MRLAAVTRSTVAAWSWPGQFESLTGAQESCDSQVVPATPRPGIASPPSAIVRLVPARRRPLRLVEDQVAVPDVIVDLEGNVIPGACPVDFACSTSIDATFWTRGGVTANVESHPRWQRGCFPAGLYA